jgi:hypothetical protein
VTDEDGTVFHLGATVTVGRAQAERLRLGPVAGQFTFLSP